MRRNNLVFLILAVGLSGCSTADKKLATIGSIQDREIVLEEPQGNLAIDEHKARKYYQEFLSITNDYQMYSQALRRLADLQLKIGEEKLSGEDQRTLQAGHQDTQASIRLYTTYLETHPNHPNNDQILYQLAKAYELDGQPGKSVVVKCCLRYAASVLPQKPIRISLPNIRILFFMKKRSINMAGPSSS
jgi:hypothetical protein